MKKIFFIAPFPPPIHGASLRNQSVADSTLINAQFNLRTFSANQASDVDDIGRFSWRKVFRTITDTKRLILSLHSFKPDLVYFNISLFGFALYRDILYATIFKLLGFKLLYHLRTQGVRQQIEESRIKYWLFRYLFHNVQVVCLSRALYQDIAPVYKSEPFIVNNGIALLNGAHIPRPLNPNKICTILFLSNLSVLKGIDDFLAALKLLTDQGYKFKARIVGKDFDYTAENLKKKIRKTGLYENTQVVGPLYGQAKLNALHEADIFVLPTHFEAFPGVILEAMQFGLPVISTIEGAIPELVDDGKTGILVEKKNVQSLSKAIGTLLDNSALRKNMGEEGRTKFMQSYTLEVFERKMIQVFDQVLHNAN